MEKSSFLIAGKHTVTEILKNRKRKVRRIFLTENSKKTLNIENKNRDLLKDIKIFYKTRKELDRLCAQDKVLHQGIIAEVEHLDQVTIKEYLKQNSKKKNILFVALEDVTDPRNIGSIIRSAASFNIDGIIIKERSFPSESKLLYKSASGCTELINVFKVPNINSSLKYLKTKNFWISSFASEGNKNFIDHDWNGNNVLVFGSEGYGLKFHTKKNSDFLLKVDIDDKVESLNISNTAAIVFHYLNLLRRKNSN